MVLVDLAQLQYATSLFLPEAVRPKDRTVLYWRDDCLIVDAPLGRTAVSAEGVWPATVGVRTKVLHAVAQRCSGKTLKLAFEPDTLHMDKTRLTAVEVEITKDGMHEFNRAELAAEFERARNFGPWVKEGLSYDDMTALSEMFNGWSQCSTLPPLQCAYYAGMAEGFGSLANEVGVDWLPVDSGPESLMKFMARRARGL